jgi:tRNA pseudouridine65 synthase
VRSPTSRPGLDLLHRDASIVVVDKPSGLAVHRGWAPERDVLVARARELLGQQVFACHRLDRGASGTLALALTAESARRFAGAHAAGSVRRRYVALVRGVPPARWVVDHPVRVGEDGQGARVPAVTAFELLEVIGCYALVTAIPRTGRLHQIRRHLKHASLPILGDVTYGKGEHNRACRTRYGLDRLFLHAAELAFPHPVTGAEIRARAPLPAELLDVIAAMRLDPPAREQIARDGARPPTSGCPMPGSELVAAAGGLAPLERAQDRSGKGPPHDTPHDLPRSSPSHRV